MNSSFRGAREAVLGSRLGDQSADEFGQTDAAICRQLAHQILVFVAEAEVELSHDRSIEVYDHFLASYLPGASTGYAGSCTSRRYLPAPGRGVSRAWVCGDSSRSPAASIVSRYASVAASSSVPTCRSPI